MQGDSEEAIGSADDDINVIVMSSAGKPIFARNGTAPEIARICSLLQSIQASTVHNNLLGLGDIKCLKSGSMCMVFMVVDAITLVAISKSNQQTTATEAYLRLLLEYTYAHLIVSFTDSVQAMLRTNPSFDLGAMLSGATEQKIREVLQNATDPVDAARFLLGAAQPLFPFNPVVRDQASRTLQSVATENTVFAFIVAGGDRLVTLVQPSYKPHQMRQSDFHLLLQFVARPGVLSSSDLWFPVCLPRFNSSGFLYCYTNCLHVESKVVLALVSQIGTTKQFTAFRTAAFEIRRQLGIKKDTTDGSVLKILDFERTLGSDATTDVSWRRDASSDEVDADGSDEDYVDASGEGDRMIPFVGVSASVFYPRPLLDEIQTQLYSGNRASLLKEYLEIAGALHFVFRLDVPVAVPSSLRQGKKKPSHFPQCLSSLIPPCFQDDKKARRKLWSMYQQLNLRLRLGSATFEATQDAFDMITSKSNGSGIGSVCPAIGLAECPPCRSDGITSVVDGEYTFLALNGKEFEIYLAFSSNVPVHQAATQGSRLARRLIMDQKTIFLAQPLTWKD